VYVGARSPPPTTGLRVFFDVCADVDDPPADVQEDIHMIRVRLAEEAVIAGRYGTGPWAFFRGALFELSRKGMRNRVTLVFCSFALQNMSGAAGRPLTPPCSPSAIPLLPLRRTCNSS
jgi:hypothetical protein